MSRDSVAFWCYQTDWFGASETSWEVYWSIDDDILLTVDESDFPEWLDGMRDLGYTNIYINTIESWEALA